MTKLRDTIKAIVDPIKAGIEYVGKNIIKPVVTLGGTFTIEESATLASFIAQVPDYDNMSQQDQQTYVNAFHQSKALALAKQSGNNSFLNIGENRSKSLLSMGSAERRYDTYNNSGDGSSSTASVQNMIKDAVGSNLSINDFSQANELNAFAEAFTVDPDLGKGDYSTPNIEIGDE